MTISRRKFFRIGVLPAIALLAPNLPVLAQAVDFPVRRSKTFGFKDFRDQIGSKFKISDGIETREAILTEVESAESAGENQDNVLYDSKCFSLTFKLATTFPGSQATYDVRHAKLGDFQLFMVPGELALNQPLLIAIINRSY